MSLHFYNNSLSYGMRQQPKDYYHDLQQAFIDSQWDNTAVQIVVKEQDDFGLNTYHDIEVWINKVIGQTTTFAKNGQDYRQLLFKDIDKQHIRGLYYKFEDDYWIVDFVNPSQGLSNAITVRRCNNALRIIDPENGSIFSIPCVVDYDMTSPTMLINSNILTPNNHAIVYVQANENTIRLFTLNKRFILNGRPFKLLAYQNALNVGLDNQNPSILYLDLYLDEIQDGDNLETHVAYNGEYNYSLQVDSNALNLSKNATGYINTTITLNNQPVNREVVWLSENPDIITFYSDGKYEVFGDVGETVEITVILKDNEDISQTLNVTVVENTDISPFVYLSPTVEMIKQYQTVITDILVEYNGQTYQPDNVVVSLSESEIVLNNDYLSINLVQNHLTLECKKYGSLQNIYVTINNTNPVFEVEKSFEIECKSIFG